MNNSTIAMEAHKTKYNNELLPHYLPVSLFFAIAALIGVVGNLIVVKFYGRKKQPKTSFTYLVRWLAWADFTVCVMLFAGAVEIGININFDFKYVCKVSYFLYQWTIYSSTWILGIISVDRYRKICQPFKSQMTTRVARIAVKVTLFPTFLLSVRNVITYDIVNADVTMSTDNGTVVVTGYYCGSTTDQDLKIYVTVSNMTDIVALSLLLLIYLIAYGLIAHKLVAHRKMLQALNIFKFTGSNDSILDTTISKCASCDHSRNQSTSDIVAKVQIELQNIRNADKANQHAEEVERNKISNNGDVKNEVEDVTEDSGNTLGLGHDMTISETSCASSATNSDSNVKIHKVTPRHGTKQGIKRSEYLITVMMVWVTVIFLLTFSSFFIGTIVFRQEPNSEQSVKPLTHFMIKCVFLNSVANPIIYYMCNASFKMFVKDFILCKKQSR